MQACLFKIALGQWRWLPWLRSNLVRAGSVTHKAVAYGQMGVGCACTEGSWRFVLRPDRSCPGQFRPGSPREFAVKHDGFVHLGSPLSCKTVVCFFIVAVFYDAFCYFLIPDASMASDGSKMLPDAPKMLPRCFQMLPRRLIMPPG